MTLSESLAALLNAQHYIAVVLACVGVAFILHDFGLRIRLRRIERNIDLVDDRAGTIIARLFHVNVRLDTQTRYLDAIRAVLLTNAKRVDVGRIMWAKDVGGSPGFVGVASYCDGLDIRFVSVHREDALSADEMAYVSANEQRIWDVLKWKMHGRESAVVRFDELIEALKAEDEGDAGEGTETEAEDGGEQPAV